MGEVKESGIAEGDRVRDNLRGWTRCTSVAGVGKREASLCWAFVDVLKM